MIKSRSELFSKALRFRAEGRLYDLADAGLDDVFRGSVDRFVEIAFRLQGSLRVLDVGAGHGILVAFLSALGHECHAVDHEDMSARFPLAYGSKDIEIKNSIIGFKVCNIEVDPLPFEDNSFDAVVCCQVLEHFTHSHLPAVREMLRVLVSGGLLEVDVPNAVSFRNRSRIIRGRNITYDYAEHYLHAKPILYANKSFYPLRHNREFTRDELTLLLVEAGFKKVDVTFLKSRRLRTGLSRMQSMGTALKDLVPSFRKSLIGWAVK
ncbi:class I SAM-dependent methyltransferase [Polynucleobacter sp. AM-7D1]|uniref:class I SAM-dependent methyltransferase n=1 Tax=Polynucleobacter sp. AM-7D1 TaxID=2689102 RepID=UPI001BFD1EE9|nr:class I SAM-dependent methyltransferase [Polynucleobacter sp. AM-7D1]QWE28106.1 class I SAM-dependent methyltransferase [Polynucleobacter sp. AM-7D1]